MTSAKAYRVLMIPALLAMLALSACAKKDSDFAARYAKNAAGATVKDQAAAVAAGESAALNGLQSADVVMVQKSATGSATKTVTSQIVINGQQVPVTTTHTANETREGTVEIAGFLVQFHAMCANTACDPYFAAMEVYKNGQLILQEGLRINFAVPENSVYQLFKPSDARVFIHQDVTNPSGMVGYLNSYTSPAATAAPGQNLGFGM